MVSQFYWQGRRAAASGRLGEPSLPKMAHSDASICGLTERARNNYIAPPFRILQRKEVSCVDRN